MVKNYYECFISFRLKKLSSFEVASTNLNELIQQLISIKQKLMMELKRCEEIVIEENHFNIKEWEASLKQKLANKNLNDCSESEGSDLDFVEVSNNESIYFFIKKYYF